jgi:putative SOS response-associated peptidase YedK
MRFCWLLPNRAPMFNIRSDNPQLPLLARALVPASAFFEFSGEKTRKSKHRVTLNAAPFMAIAAAWKPAKGNEPASFALVTTEPGADILPYHPRQMAVLQPSEWQAWLAGGDLRLLRALPAGTLAVETIRQGSGAAAPGKPGSLL